MLYAEGPHRCVYIHVKEMCTTYAEAYVTNIYITYAAVSILPAEGPHRGVEHVLRKHVHHIRNVCSTYVEVRNKCI